MANAFLQIEEPNSPDKKIQSVTATVDDEEVHAEVIQLRGDGGEDFIDGDAAQGLDVDVTRIKAPTGINGGDVSVGTTEVELAFTGTTKVISIKAASTNSGLVWFGLTGIGNDGSGALGELTADAAVEIELDDTAAAIFVISDTAAQTVYRAALT